MQSGLLRILAFVALTHAAAAADWIRQGVNTNEPVWGVRGNLLFAIHPGGFSGGDGGPRGLIRLGYPTLTNGGYDLINFIAIEPVVKGRRGFSELERSSEDGRPGKKFWIESPATITTNNGLEQLQIVLILERFNNGARVHLRMRQRSDAPDELRIAVETEPGSAPLDYCILTATMGNKGRTRQLWLRDEVINSLNLYADYREDNFAPSTVFSLSRVHRTKDDDVLVAATNDESHPEEVYPFPNSRHWYYGGSKVTQYWRKSAATIADDLSCVVNGRFTYWKSKRPVPGGIAFENFELRQKFRQGDEFIFGITPKTPQDLGFSSHP